VAAPAMHNPYGLTSMGACERGAWHLELWKRDGSDPSRRQIPFRCRSWRHAGECREWCGRCDYIRCHEALTTRPHWTCIVLTYPLREWPIARELFRFGVVSWSRLRKRIVREFGKTEYIQTWEQHKSGYPHVNIALCNTEFFLLACKDRKAIVRSWLLEAATECGFGKEMWVTPMYNADGFARYMTKLAKELTGAAVKDQVPVNAPRHFRRLRASRGTLPPRHKDPSMTGKLIKRPLTELQPAR